VAMEGVDVSNSTRKIKHESDKEILERLQESFKILHSMAQAVANGEMRSLTVYGAGGVGKTFALEKVLNAAKTKNNLKVNFVSGIVTPVELFKILSDWRHEGNVTVLDDSDNVLFEENSITLLKAALDTKKHRRITYKSSSPALADYGDTIDYYGSIVFITNYDFDAYIAAGRSKITQNLEALMTRTNYFDLHLHTIRERRVWVDHVVSSHDILVAEGCTKTQQTAALKYLKDNESKMRELSIRTALKLGSFIRSQGTNWMRFADATLLKQPGVQYEDEMPG
jgi:hypothetical protein